MKRYVKNILIACTALAGTYLVASAVARKKSDEEKENIDADNPYRNAGVCEGSRINTSGSGNSGRGSISSGDSGRASTGTYETIVKPIIDRALSFGGLALLSPLFAAVSAAVWIDDPGPVFFTQKRIGKDKTYFLCHKFRTMKMSAPHDVPTHQLEHPEQYITRVGKFLRKTSLDELPQIWDIFRGKMSVIGPRPALWNQDDLVAERDKYGANDILPGLTGWAQIRGRDELEIPDKARLDGEYVRILRQGGMAAFRMDVKCFVGTVGSVICHDGVVEGGTGRIHTPLTEYNSTSPKSIKKILITGAGSYIGEQVKEYLNSCDNSEYYIVDTVDTKGLHPLPEIFAGYDVVLNTAGIAHVKETDKNRSLYYEVNRDLSIAIARAAKEAGAGQFILLSSMAVYGMTTGRIKKDTVPFPDSAYGESKLSADEMIEGFADEHFRVAILRPPMVYGKGCKGNYQTLRAFALRSPVFPDFSNKRSMIYIGNLCEFIKRLIDTEQSGLFFPQNQEYVNTADMVKEVAGLNGNRIRTVRIFNPIIRCIPVDILKKVFGSLIYEKGDLINKYSFEESIKLTEQ